MAMTKVFLLSVPLEKDSAHTLWFPDPETQLAYFYTKLQNKHAHSDFTYQRKDDVIRVPVQIDELWKDGINYVMYQNTAYNDKWFFAFITDMKYVNDGRTDITIKTDCLQTWMFEKVMKPCFVEREHAKDDSIGANTVPEGLETGEYIANRHTRSQYADDLCVVVGYTQTAEGIQSTPGLYNGLWSGIEYSAFEPMNENAEYGLAAIREFIKAYDQGAAEAISIMFLCPKRMIETVTNGPEVHYTNSVDKKFLNGESADMSVAFSTLSLDGHTPRNNKLMTFPFRYLLASNNNGSNVVYHYEQFYKKDEMGKKTVVTNPEFLIEGVMAPGCSIRMVPMDYKGIHRNDDEGINMGKFPILNWTSDAYTNWLTQNGVNIAVQVATGIGQIVGGALAAVGTGGVGTVVGAGLASGGVTTITNTLAQIHTQSFTPAQAQGNINAGDVITAAGQNDFHFYDMTVKKEYALILDEYFDMYGYKTNRVKIPAENHRKNFWFTKTIDANITGPIPQEDLQTIKDCYNQGVTYWKNPLTFKDYTVANGTI